MFAKFPSSRRAFARGWKFEKFLTLTTFLAATAALILLAIAYGAHVSSQRNAVLSFSAFDISDTELRLSHAYALLLEAESSQRGYLLTDDATYLGPFAAVRDKAAKELAGAERGLAKLDLDASTPTLGKLRGIIDEKLGELDHTVDLARQGKRDEALAVVRGNLGRDLMAQARDLVQQQLRALALVRARRVEAARQNGARLTQLTTLGVISVAILSLLGVSQIARRSADLAAAQAKLGRINEALEERVRERTAELEAANVEIQRYAYVVSHDLRAPLVNIIGFARELEGAAKTLPPLVADERADPDAVAAAGRAIGEDIPEAIRFIQLSAARMDSLINAILSLSRVGRLQLQPQELDLHALAESCAASVQHRLNEAGATLSIEGRLPRLIGDRRAIEQVVANLIDNAAKYLTSERPGRIVLRAHRRDARIFLEVEDNGRGVAAADQERIFDLFRRAGKQDRPGEGIGLAHVRSLLRRMGGDIAVRSDGASGSVFTIALPADLRAAQAEGAVHA